MAITARTRTIGVSIGRPPEAVYEYVRHPGNLPEWAPSFCSSISEGEDGLWLMETPTGPATLRFAPANEFGVLDHYIGTAQRSDEPAAGTGLPPASSAAELYVPMRVVPNGPGSEVLFTLFRAPDVPEEAFSQDMATVRSDLDTLKKMMES